MSATVEMPVPVPDGGSRRPGALQDPAARGVAAAGGLLVGGLALALAGVGGAALPLAVGGCGLVAAGFVVGPGAARAARRHALPLAVAVLGALAVVLVGASAVLGVGVGVDALGSLLALGVYAFPPLAVLVGGVGGLVLLADALRARIGGRRADTSPWRRLTRSGSPAPGGSRDALRALAGLALIAFAGLVALALAYSYVGVGSPGGLAGLALVGLVVLAALVVPVLVAGAVRTDREDAADAREDERVRIAAHLHDSVLQTLALVQRQAHDPAAVARLARRQEHDLRAWMAGEAALGARTLAGALRDAVVEVEEELGATVEVTVLGDRPLDAGAEALAAAAREALRNAARHAPGAPTFLFAQLGPDVAEAYVRDEGPGFVPEEVATERRGVRDAIVGRMAAAGGSGTVESAPGAGTEVTLRLAAPEAVA